MRVAIVASHPVQYQAPWFRALAEAVDLQVFFAWKPTPEQQAVGFGGSFQWDLDLLSGYKSKFLINRAERPSTSRFTGCDTPEVRALIRTQDFDVLIVCGWYLKSYWQAIRAGHQKGIPVLVRGDSQLLTPRSAVKRAAKVLLSRYLVRQFDAFLVVGKRNTEYLLHYGARRERLFFVPHFVDNDRFRIDAQKTRVLRRNIRRTWGIADSAFCVLFSGKFIHEKRPFDLLQAVSLLTKRKELSDVHILWAGRGALGSELRANCNVVFDAENRDPSACRPRLERPAASFTGFLNQTQISKAYIAADLLVLPSESETWGLVVNEAFASGIPAVVSESVGCAADLIEHGRTGFTFKTADVTDLAQKIVEAMKLNERSDVVEQALSAKITQYTVGAAVRGTLQAIEAATRRCFSATADEDSVCLQ
jgi:glycosyltransferase involved in cell wall biosynthesis